MKCTVMDNCCAPVVEPRSVILDRLTTAVLRLFRYRHLRALAIERAIRDQRRRQR